MDKQVLIEKWLRDELTEAEQQAFKALDDAALYEEIVEEAQRFSGYKTTKVPSFEDFDKRLEAKSDTNSTNWLKVAMKIAAVFVIGLTAYTFLNQNSNFTYTTDLAQNETITLPDNSRVDLNELSQLEYSSKNWDENRTLELSGEAFFDVEKGQRFEVITDQGVVSVLGTEFNVLSRENIFKVSCYEGLVQVSYGDEAVKLPAGSELVLESGIAKTSEIAIAEPYWLKTMSVFENAKLSDVIAELEKQYDIQVSYKLDSIVHFTGAFEHNNLENALKSVTNPLNLTFIIINDKEVKLENAQN